MPWTFAASISASTTVRSVGVAAEHQVRHDLVKRGARGLPPPAALELRIELSLTGSRMVTVIFGNSRRRTCVRLSRLKIVASGPSMCTGTTIASDLSAIIAGAVVDFHQAAGDGDAAFRKDDQHVAVAHRVDDGAQRKRLERIERHGAHEFEERLDPPVLRHRDVDGEDRPLGQQRHRQRRIEEAHMVERDDGVVAGLGDVLVALDFELVEGAEHDREEIVHPARRHGAADRDGDHEIGDADEREQRRHAEAELLQQRRNSAPTTMKAALSTLTAATTRARRSAPAQACTAAKVGTTNRPPRDRKPGEIDRDVNAVRRGKEVARCPACVAAGTSADAVQPRSSENRPSSTAPISVGRSTMRPAASHAARPEPTATATEKMVRKTVIDLVGAVDVDVHQRQQQRQHQRADQPEPAHHQRAPPQPRVGAQILDQVPGRRQDVAIDRKVRRALAGCAE